MAAKKIVNLPPSRTKFTESELYFNKGKGGEINTEYKLIRKTEKLFHFLPSFILK